MKGGRVVGLRRIDTAVDEWNGGFAPTMPSQVIHSLQQRLRVTYRNSMLTATLMVGLLSVLFGQSNPKPMPEPKFSELSKDDTARLERQRAVVVVVAKRYSPAPLTGTKSDLLVLQRLIDDKVFTKSQTYELQCLGVAFGDVLTSELPLRWMMVTDEYGTDPTLRFKKTTLQINALTMISKRVERDEHVDVSELLRITREQLEQIGPTMR
jgi:hypothetical protein